MSQTWNQNSVYILLLLLCTSHAVVKGPLPSDVNKGEHPEDNREDHDTSQRNNNDLAQGFKPRWIKAERMQKKLYAEPTGNTVMFQCRVEANPAASVIWFRDDNTQGWKKLDKKGRVGGYKIRNDGQMIILESVIPADDGLYRCVARNKFGFINHTYELDVQDRTASAPFVAEGYLRNETAYVGGKVTFKCKVFSDALLHIEWIRSRRVGNKTYLEMLKSYRDANDSVMRVLEIKNVTLDDAGEYTCIAGNSIGVSDQSAFLTVLPEPSPTLTVGAVPLAEEVHRMAAALMNLAIAHGDLQFTQDQLSEKEKHAGVIGLVGEGP